MTLGKLMELYKAEQEGKKIIKRTWLYSNHMRPIHYDVEVILSDCELDEFFNQRLFGNEYVNYEFFIKE